MIMELVYFLIVNFFILLLFWIEFENYMEYEVVKVFDL